MKAGVLILSLILLIHFSAASIEVRNYTVNDISSPTEILSGEINISITGEDANTLIKSNSGDEITLSEFLEKCGVRPECIPSNCSSKKYTENDKVASTIELNPGQKKILGLAIHGPAASVTNLTFNFTSDFSEAVSLPIKALIFETQKYEFDKFSENIFSAKNWGCFNYTNKKAISSGSQIGPAPLCEDVYLTKTNRVRAGAKINRTGSATNQNLTMSLYYKSGGAEIQSCKYGPDEVESGKEYCDMTTEPGIFFEEGEYKICVSSDIVTDYRIYNENSGNNCGSIIDSSFVPNKDYSVFVQTAEYSNGALLEKDFYDKGFNLVDLANNYIKERYDNNCSDTCILPIELTPGVPQNFIIENPHLQYFANGGYTTTTDIYTINETPAKMSYSGVLNLRMLNFSVPTSMNYKVKIGDTEIFNKTFNISSAPKINLLVPKSVPAGVPVKFTADVTFNGSKTLTYNWDFDDGTTNKTSVNYIEHTYNKFRHYTIKLNVSAGKDLSDTREFDIEAITPKLAIANNLALKRGLIASLEKTINSVPSWYKQALSDTAKLESTIETMDSIEKSQQAATVDADFISIVRDIYKLEVPSSIKIESYDRPYLANTPDDVNIAPIYEMTSEVATSSNEEYKEPIISWQNKNIEGSILEKIYDVKLESGDSIGSLSTYVFKIKSDANEESYFIMNKKLSELRFSKSVGAKQVSDYTVVPIQALEQKDIEFYYSGSEPLSYFVSPRLSSITIESGIDTTCNYNFICEKSLGENSTNCRSDCLPTKKLVLYVMSIILGAILLYTLIGIWYSKHYERYLFKDKRELFNILMFVSNAKAHGMSDGKISSNLRRQGWSKERVSYIIKKANGKRTGLPEIIPISSISRKIRDAKMRKQFEKQPQNNVMTDPRQQPPRNINKSGFTRKL